MMTTECSKDYQQARRIWNDTIRQITRSMDYGEYMLLYWNRVLTSCDLSFSWYGLDNQFGYKTFAEGMAW